MHLDARPLLPVSMSIRIIANSNKTVFPLPVGASLQMSPYMRL